METDTLEGIIALLAPSIGEQTARAVVTREAAALGLGSQLTENESTRLLRQIEMLSGPAGLAARLALVRARRAKTQSVTMPALPMSRPTQAAREQVAPAVQVTASTASSPDEPPASHGREAVPVADLAGLFAKSLGETVAEALVKKAMARTGLVGRTIARRDAALVLDQIEAEGGVPGAVARFAKVRFLLKYA
jgi:hypothetical protein